MLYEVLAALCNDRSCIEINGNGCGLIDRHWRERERERESAMVIPTCVSFVSTWAVMGAYNEYDKIGMGSG